MKKNPITMTELRLRLSEETREKIFKWLQDGQNLKELDIEVNLYHHLAGELGTLDCEVKRWNPPSKDGWRKDIPPFRD